MPAKLENATKNPAAKLRFIFHFIHPFYQVRFNNRSRSASPILRCGQWRGFARHDEPEASTLSVGGTPVRPGVDAAVDIDHMAFVWSTINLFSKRRLKVIGTFARHENGARLIRNGFLQYTKIIRFVTVLAHFRSCLPVVGGIYRHRFIVEEGYSAGYSHEMLTHHPAQFSALGISSQVPPPHLPERTAGILSNTPYSKAPSRAE